MMSPTRCWPLAVALVAAGPALAQGVTDAQTSHDVVIPGLDVPEGTLRFATPDIDWSNALDARTPSNVRRPHVGVNQPVVYDPATRTESVGTLPPAGTAMAGKVAGSVMGAAVGEPVSLMSSPSAISPADAYPWRTQCRVFFSQSGLNYVCSGTLIDPRHVITAGHCVHEGNGGAWSTNVTVAPSWDGDSDAYGNANGISMTSWTGWTASGDFNWDHGSIRIDRPFGFITGWLGYGWNGSDSFFTSNNWDWAGYPGCGSTCVCAFAGCPNQLYYDFGTFDSVTTYRLNTSLTSFCNIGGMSGSGIYWRDTAGDRYVYGVTSTHSWVGCTETSAGFTRITQPWYDWVHDTFIPGGYGAALDLVPLDVNTSSSVVAGAKLGFFDVLVCNMSDANPASATYGFDVYLSGNDNISTADTLLGARSYSWDFAARSTVRINSNTNPPQIPQGTVPGDYWIGVITTDGDANTSNDDTDGWDAAPITVTRKFPTLPATSLGVGSNGVLITFDNLVATPSYLAVNRLNGDTLATDTNAWVNFGQLAPVGNAFRGNGSCELGVNPGVASTSPDPIAALVVRLDGLNGSNLVMDFEAINYGEETDEFDGIWISQTGATWLPLATPWASTSGRWQSIRNVQLTGATSVNTDLAFYVAFAVQDNTAFGLADGVAIDDLRIHLVGDATMTVSDFYSPQIADLHIHSAPPASAFGCWALSVSGGGPIGSPFGTVLLSPPIVVHDCQLLVGGAANATWQLPPGFTGLQVWVQGVEIGASIIVTNGLGIVLK